MYQVELTCGFVTKTKEQAEHIRKFFDDAQALMSCESSSFKSTEITEFGLARRPPVFDEILFESHGEASAVLEALRKIIQTYGVTTVADLNELAGLTGTFVDIKWGWKNLTDVEIERLSAVTAESIRGWIIKFPRPDFIEDLSRSQHG